MFIAKIEEIIAPEDLKRINEILDKSEFVDGHISGGDERNKSNLELRGNDKNYIESLKMIEMSVKRSLKFNFTAFPRYMTRPIISKYTEGMYYDEHYDYPIVNFLADPSQAPEKLGLAPVGHNYVRADLSMTLFLSDPSSYGGGELFFPGVAEQLQFKLPAGSGILYPTGARHGVRKVTSGARVAAIFWIQTMLPNETERRSLHELHGLMRSLRAKYGECEEAGVAEESFYNLFRHLAQI